MRIHISGRKIVDSRTLSSGSVPSLAEWDTRKMWSRLCSPLSASVGWRCTWSLASPACLRILCSAILAWKAAASLALTKHCRVSLYRSPHHFMPRKFNTRLLFFSDLGVWFLNQIFDFLYYGTLKAFFGHFGHIQRQTHAGQFPLYPTSLPCHSCRHDENVQDIVYCF
jgi:hypothetical protein